ncbi:hypothetical protein BD770DRAFT_218479 [Pilaira anomala]|nr:hypothetical protein BD770DRAFT_218479 [Pilaira anomala]
MNRLDYDLHSRILVSLAGVLADTRAKTTDVEIERLVSKCPDVTLLPIDDMTILTPFQVIKGRMTNRYQQTLDALVKYAVKTNEVSQIELLPRILSYLKHLPAYGWDDIILTKGTTTPDNVTYNLVYGLLNIAHQRPEHAELIYETLWSYGRCIIDLIDTYNNSDFTVSFILPSLAGLARALQLSPYLYKPEQLQAIYLNMQPLLVDRTLTNINLATDTCLSECDKEAYSRRVLSSYWEAGMPLSSNRVIHDFLITLRNVTARMIASSSPVHETVTPKEFRKLHLTTNIESAWSELMKKTAEGIRPEDRQWTDLDRTLDKNLRSIYVFSLGYFDDIRKYAERRETEGKTWSPRSYMKEIMGTSLV